MKFDGDDSVESLSITECHLLQLYMVSVSHLEPVSALNFTPVSLTPVSRRSGILVFCYFVILRLGC